MEISTVKPLFHVNSDSNETFKFMYDGVLSLGPQTDQVFDNFLQLMKKQGFITKAMFALNLHLDKSFTPSITLGGYNEADFKNKSDALHWFKSANDSWKVEVNNVLYGNVSFDDGIKNYAIFDTMYRGFYLPIVEFQNLTSKL